MNKTFKKTEQPRSEYAVDEMDDVIYIGADFPDEYANSRYSTKALPTCDDKGNGMKEDGI